jgi:uncharacterized protein
MAKKKIFNDPVYGFVSVPYGIVFDLIEHPYFQRLRRIKQVSMTHYVYPGALHTRFHHALGALHLMNQALSVLREKGTDITDEEFEAAVIAILLHDIGHGPFSHTLENTLINVSHEQLSELFMEKLNEEFDGKLDMAISIFQDDYHKPFLHQLVSGQLDMDRMDYLNRDSFFTGVYEGVIGYDRIIKMLAVRDGQLVVEEKGIYSIEKFLIARRLMYWQVYLHKTVLSAERMLIQALRRARTLSMQGHDLHCPPSLAFFLRHDVATEDFRNERDRLLQHFAALDDYDIISAVKSWIHYPDRLLAYLCSGIINRRLFRLELSDEPIPDQRIQDLRTRLHDWWGQPDLDDSYLLLSGRETNRTYNVRKEEINILYKSGEVRPMSSIYHQQINTSETTKFYLCFPKVLRQYQDA